MLLTEEILDEILVDYILENFEIEDEEDLEYVYESLSEDDVDYILNEFNASNFAKELPGKFRELKKSAKDSFYKAKERFFRPKPKRKLGKRINYIQYPEPEKDPEPKRELGKKINYIQYPDPKKDPEPKNVSGTVSSVTGGAGSASNWAQRRTLQRAFNKEKEKRQRENALKPIKRPTAYLNRLESDSSQKLPFNTVRIKGQEAKRRKAATQAAIQQRLAQQAAIFNPFLPKASSYLPKDILRTGEREGSDNVKYQGSSDIGKYQGKRGLIHPREGGLPNVIRKSTGAPLYGGAAEFKSMFPGTEWKVKTKK